MTGTTEMHANDIEPLAAPEPPPADLSVSGYPSICSFLEVDVFTQTVLVVRFTKPGTFRWFIQERDASGQWSVVAHQDVTGALPAQYNLSCYAHQQIGYTCLTA